MWFMNFEESVNELQDENQQYKASLWLSVCQYICVSAFFYSLFLNAEVYAATVEALWRCI